MACPALQLFEHQAGNHLLSARDILLYGGVEASSAWAVFGVSCAPGAVDFAGPPAVVAGVAVSWEGAVALMSGETAGCWGEMGAVA